MRHATMMTGLLLAVCAYAASASMPVQVGGAGAQQEPAPAEPTNLDDAQAPAVTTQDDIDDHEAGRSLPGASEKEIDQAVRLSSRFRSPGALAFNAAQQDAYKNAAKEAWARIKTEEGDLSSKYDVIVQIGHYPRTKGKTGGQGRLINEQQAAAWVAEMLVAKLRAAGLRTALIPADDFRSGLTTRAFIALHTDASKVRCRLGPSLGYREAKNKGGMNMLAVAVAVSLDIDPKTFMKHGYTKDLREYYAYSRIEASDYEGVLEMFELTCPEQENSFLGEANALADNLAIAIELSLKE